MLVTNITKGTIVGNQIDLADSFFSRLIGLLGRKRLDFGEGLILRPCKAVHGLGMRFTCEVIYLSKNGEVLRIHTLKPGGRGPLLPSSNSVIELPVGTVARAQIEVGDLLQIDPNTESSP